MALGFLRLSLSGFSLCVVTGSLLAAPLAGVDSISLRLDGKDVLISDSLEHRLSQNVQTMMRTCGLNSIEHAQAFQRFQAAATTWNKTLSQSHLYIRFSEPFENVSWSGKKLPISEVLIGFEHEYFIGPELTRHNGVAAEHIKCGGFEALEIMCMPELAMYLRKGQRDNCGRVPGAK